MLNFRELRCAAGRLIHRPDSWGGLNWQVPCEWNAVEVLTFREIRVALCQHHLDVIVEDLYDAVVNKPRSAFLGWKVIGNPRTN